MSRLRLAWLVRWGSDMSRDSEFMARPENDSRTAAEQLICHDISVVLLLPIPSVTFTTQSLVNLELTC